MSILSNSKCILFLSDDGVSVYNTSPSKVVFVDSFLWGAENFEKNISDTLAKKCGGSSVIFINDMVEQHYRKERILKAGIMDQSSIIKRRVANVFPSLPLRSAIKLKEKAPIIDGDKNSDIYLLAAMPMTEGLLKTVSAVQSTSQKIAGVCLLPLEATSMVQALSKKMPMVDLGTGTEWTILVGQHRGDGLRQIVIKNGELALTRLTPISSYTGDVDVWVADVANELRGTMTYLSRFGFTQNDTLKVIVIGDDKVTSRLPSKVDFDCDLNILSVNEAANLLGLNLGRQSDNHFSDVLHVASIVKKKSFLMPFVSPKINAINQPIIMAEAASAILFCLTAYLSFDFINKVSSISSYSSQIEIAAQEQISHKQQRDVEVEQKNKLGLDFILVDRATTAFESLDSQLMLPLQALKKIGDAMIPDIHAQGISIKPTVTASVDPFSGGQGEEDLGLGVGGVSSQDPTPKSYDIVLSFVAPPTLDLNLGVKIISEYEAKLKEIFPKSSVSVIKQLADLSYTGNFVGSASNEMSKDPQTANSEAQIMVRGPLQ